ncbi:MAG: hypothetical protein Q4P71_04435 [Actinomycetaceae bacterium]|nr:hypothetical protein [Actinomycetaceae bacterium]
MLFTSRPTLPEPFSHVVERKPFNRIDRKRPALELESGNWLLLARQGPCVISETDAQFISYWHEIQQAKWDGETKTLSIDWVDPTREPITMAAKAEEPHEFMMSMQEYVEYVVVSSGQRVADNGTTITASIRRREDGELFSALVADGPLDEQGEELAHQLERRLREGVGLDY